MNTPKSEVLLYDQYGNKVNSPAAKLRSGGIKKQAIGLFPNMYMFPEYGNFRPRFYTLSDTEQGLDALSRELLVRWSREMFGQLPFVPVGANLKASFTVGNEYLPRYRGKKTSWGRKAEEFLANTFFPNCCTRGYAYDFQTSLHLLSFLLDQDGDILSVFIRDENNMPRFQMIPSHRLRALWSGEKVQGGPYDGMVCYDGVIYDERGKTIAWNIVEPTGVQQLTQTIATMPMGSVQLSTKQARLIFDPKFFDKSRGIPSISSAILNAISMQELYSYLSEKIKLEATVGLIEKNQAGEAPLEYADVLDQLNNQALEFGIQQPSPTTHGVQVISGPSIRYVKAEGGELTTLQSNSPPTQTMDFLRKLETQILSTMGVPHSLIYSPEQISGRIVSGVVEGFRSSIKQRQFILDKYARLMCGWAVAVAMKEGILPETDEPVYNVFDFTHPKPFTMDEGYDRAADLKDFAAGVVSLEELAAKRNTTAEAIISQKEKEATMLLDSAKRVSEQTGVDFNIALSTLRENLVKVSAKQGDGAEMGSTPEGEV